ncbi:MAG: right-handed parallel beta-helix repeat-containing protein, partial [Bacteroidales bacterium]
KVILTVNYDGSCGGIYCDYNSNPVIKNVIITNNHAGSGGGIFCGEYSSPAFENVTVAYNSADYNGGGFYFEYANPVFDSINRCNIYLNNASTGDDLYGYSNYPYPTIDVIVDTFTVLNPRSFQAYPLTNFSFDILHGLIPQLNIALYASPDGDNTNSGLTLNDPLKTIQYGLSLIAQDSINYYTMHLLNGTYSPSTNEEVFPIGLPEYLNLEGASEIGVILDAEGQSGVIEINGQYISISNLTITGGSASYNGGGIYCSGFNPTIQNVTITNNNASSGGGLFFESSNPVLENLTIANNSAVYNGGGIYYSYSNPFSQNIIISNNHAYTGGGIYFNYASSPVLCDMSIFGNSAINMGGGIYFHNSTPVFDSVNRCSIYLNDAGAGDDLYIYSYYFNPVIEVIVDTFTVLIPRSFQASPLSDFSFDILHGLIPQSNFNLYASPDGDNTNSGLTIEEPVKTINYALSLISQDSINFYTIQLLEGTYSNSTNEETFPVSLPEYVGLAGVSESTVILDAEATSGVILITNPYNVISNITVTGGNSSYGGGINCSTFSPQVLNVTVTGNHAGSGGGIYCENNSEPILQNVSILNNDAAYGGGLSVEYGAGPVLENSVIMDNSANYKGGGMNFTGSNPIIQNSVVSGNHAGQGGGIYCYDSEPVMKNANIINNSADIGGGIYFEYSSPAWDSVNRCNIYLNNAITGGDLFAQSLVEVVVDTFTVLNPNLYFVYPLNNFSFDIWHGKIDLQLVNADLYVSPQGSNSNSGLTPDDPLKTIRYASSILVTDSLNPHTIHLAEGIYSPSVTGEYFPVFIAEYCNLVGAADSSVILDGEGNAVLCLIENDHSLIYRMTIKGGGTVGFPFNLSGGIYCESSSPHLQNLILTNNLVEGIHLSNSNPVIENSVIFNNEGSGIYCKDSNPIIKNLVVRNNDGTNGYGGGLYLENSNPSLINLSIYENHASKGGGIYCYNSNPIIINSTLTVNTASFAGGIYCGAGSLATIINSVMWENQPHQIMLQGVYSLNAVEISYSDIMGGEEGIWISGAGTINWLEGNMDEDPLFVESGGHPYALLDGSPCIDMGSPDTTGLNLPNTDIIGNKRIWDGDGNGIASVDMGAYEFGATQVGIDKPIVPVRSLEFKVRCFPNPFSESTTFEYELKENSWVTLSIFNYSGQVIGLLLNEQKGKGIQQVQWNAFELPAGVYYYRISVGNIIETGKMVLVK